MSDKGIKVYASQQFVNDAISVAKTEANKYTDAEIAKISDQTAANEALLNDAKSYTDSKVSAEVNARDAAIGVAKDEANEYTDTQILSAKNTAKNYTDNKISAEVTARDSAISSAKTEANEYTDSQITIAKASVNGYTDTKVSAEATARGTAIESAKAEANEYTDSEVSKAKAAAKSYTDEQIAAIDNSAEIQSAISEAKEYTDEQVAAEVTARNKAISNAITNEAATRNTAIESAKAEANEYTDEQIATEASARATAINNAKNETKNYVDTAIDNLIGAAPDTRNTLEELSKAISDHEDVTDAINAAIGSKASNEALNAHTGDTDIHVTAEDKNEWNNAKASANAYTDTKVSTEVTNRTNAINSALAEAKEYSDTQDETTLSSAKSYTNTKVSGEATARGTAIANAKAEVNEYTDTQIASAKTSANKYTDDKITAEVTARNSAISSAKSEANEYTDEQVSSAKTSANSYTDTKVSTEVTNRTNAINSAKTEVNKYTDDQVSKTLSSAKTYTDNKMTAEVTARNTAITEAIDAEEDARTKAINSAINNEVTARNTAINSAKTEANEYTDNKISAEVTARDSAISSAKTEVKNYTDEQVLGHTHKYAGSSSVGGSANSAVKLATARKINEVSFDGTKDITITANPKTTQITDVDLNDCTTIGFYNGGGGNNCTNKPANIDAFGMIVFKNAGGHTCQVLVSGTDTQNIMYIRTYTSSSWTDWNKYYSELNKPTPAEIGAAKASHGTHVSYSSTAPVMDGTASVGSASTVARSDHKHPSDTSRASKTEFDKHTSDTTKHIYYGVCSTAADTAAKTVTIDNFSLVTGAMVIVKFSNANSASSPTLNVNNTGAKPIYRYGTTAASTGTSSTGWRDGAVQIFVYDGAGWVRDFWENNTYSNTSLGHGYGTCSTAEATTAKVVTLSSYSLSTGGIVAVKFTYAVPASATMNINSKGAKAIYYRGSAITAGVIKAGDVATFMYNGTQYHLLTVDRDENTTYSAAGSSLGLVKSGGDVTISSGVITVNDDSHNHTIANVDNLQGTLDGKQATITGGASTITGSNLTASRALISNGSGKVAVSEVTSTELGYLDGVTSNIQTQLNGKAASSHGTHVSYGTDAPKVAGTAAAGSASTVSRSDHIHPAQTSVSGNAGTATKLATARNIKLSQDMTGSASFDGSGDITINARRRRCVIGQINNTDNTTKLPYYKFASIAFDSAHTDREIVFKVSTGFGNNEKSGILRAHFRVGTEIKKESAHFYWEYANTGIDPNEFIMAYPETAKPTVELWVKVTNAHMMYHFDVLQEHDRNSNTSYWTLYNTCTDGSQSAVTAGYTQLASTLLGIKNNADSATKLTSSAGSATQPVYFKDGQPTAGTYQLNKTVPADAKFTDTVYTHPSYTARTGKPTGNQTPAFGGTATVSQITSDASGHVTNATDRTITIPSTLSNGTGTAGLIKTTSTVTSNSGYTACPVISGVPYYKDTDTKYTHPTSSGNKHIPSGGASDQILKWSADGTATWGAGNEFSSVILKSSVSGSTKKFALTINDEGTITVAEITT